jgi:hypothetical protein
MFFALRPWAVTLKTLTEGKMRNQVSLFIAESKLLIDVPMYLYKILVWLRGCSSRNKPVEILRCRAEGTFRAE